jgi:hypothetical protein
MYMPDQSDQQRGTIDLKCFLADFGAGLPDQELLGKYGLTARSYVKLIQALLERKVINPGDLDRRRELAVQRDLKRESAFLSGLMICTSCGHPSPVRFDACPACGAEPGLSADQSELSTSVINREVESFEDDDDSIELDDEPDDEPTSDDTTQTRETGKSRKDSLRSILNKKIW